MRAITLTCQHCGASFERRASYHRHIAEKRGITAVFCSNACKNASECRVPDVDVSAMYTSGMSIAAIAAKIGCGFEGVRKRLHREGVTMRSRSELSKTHNPMKGRTHSEETRAKIREAQHRQFSNDDARARASDKQREAIAAGKFAVISSVEDTVARELDMLGIKYKRQYLVRHPKTQRYCAVLDFLLEDGRALEVNGTYWHADPRAYPNGPIHASQRRTAEKYAAKSAALAEMGITLLEVWELDIDANAPVAVRAALEL